MSQLTSAVGPEFKPSWWKKDMQLPFTVYDTGRDEPYTVKPGALKGWKLDDVSDDAYMDPGYRQLITNRMWYHIQPWYVRLWLRTKLLFRRITPQSIGRLACTKQQLEDYLDLTQGHRKRDKDFNRSASVINWATAMVLQACRLKAKADQNLLNSTPEATAALNAQIAETCLETQKKVNDKSDGGVRQLPTDFRVDQDVFGAMTVRRQSDSQQAGQYTMRPGLDVKATDIAQLEWELVLDNMKAFLEANGRAPTHLHMTTLMTERIALRCIHNRTLEPTEDIRVKFKDKLLGCVPHYDAPEFKLE